MCKKQKLIELIRYCQSVAQLSISHISNYNNHDPQFSINEDSFIGLSEYVTFDLPEFINNGQSLIIPKLNGNKPPIVENIELELWIEKSNSINKAPQLKSMIVQPTIEGNNNIEIFFDDLEDKESFDEQFKQYLIKWNTWSDKEKKIKKVQKIYNELYDLQQQLDNLEILLGVGILFWKISNIKIIYPIVTMSVNLVLDQNSGNIILEPNQSKPFKLEMDALREHNLANLHEIESYFNQLFFINNEVEADVTPIVFDNLQSFLKITCNLLDSTGELQIKPVNTKLDKFPVSENAVIVNTWTIFAKAKSRAIVIDDYMNFMQKLEGTEDSDVLDKLGAITVLLEDLPEKSLDREYKHYRGICNYNDEFNSRNSVQELYFPLPFNEEQIQIIKRLDVDNGVVVQGPPGTGKTHTIANIICHFLASGKKILVTSMRSHALQVIREKLPQNIQDLAVNMLSNDNQGLQQFKDSIEKIANKIQTINIAEEQAKVNQYEEKLNYYHAELQLITQDLKKINRENVGLVKFDGIDYEIKNLAEEYAKVSNVDLSWIEDEITIEEEFDLKISKTELQKLCINRTMIIDDLHLIDTDFQKLKLIIDQFPTEEEILNIHESQQLNRVLSNSIANGTLTGIIDYSEDSLQKMEQLRNLISEIQIVCNKENLNELKAFDSWIHNCCDNLYNIINDNDNEMLIKLLDCINEADMLYKKSLGFIEKSVMFDVNNVDDEEIEIAIQKLAQSRKPFGFSSIFSKKRNRIRQILNEIRITGSHPKQDKDWQYILDYIEINRDVKIFLHRFNAFATIIACKQYKTDSYIDFITLLRELRTICKIIHDLNVVITFNKQMRDLSKKILPSFMMQKFALNDIFLENLNLLQQHIDSHIKISKSNIYHDKKMRIISLITQLPTVIKQDFDVLLEKIGMLGISSSDLSMIYKKNITNCYKIFELEPQFQTVLEIAEKIEQSGGVELANTIKHDKNICICDHDIFFEAWRIKRLKNFFSNNDCLKQIKILTEKRKNIEAELKRTYEELIARKSWINLVKNITPKIKASLILFSKAVTAIGKGTGKSAFTHRKTALNAALSATDAIPCWIIPHDKVCEFLPKNFALFDLVIIDEASQSDLIALTSIFRAKKVLIVGDDKQVSPEEIGVSEDKKRALIKQYLSNQVPLVEQVLSTKNSMYDLFSVMFSDIIMLKEHFRCVAPIIEYSKKKFYRDELLQLRIAKKSEQILPPLVDVFVKNGFRNYKDENPAEAKFIIDEIKRLASLEEFTNKTIGICTLHGNKQYKYILEQLNKDIDSYLIQKHKIKCGDPKIFQGDERDIMFLSMVVSKTEDSSFQALGKIADSARFNVATSRARDRMYLVRSIDLEDLSGKDDLRESLIKHFSDPFPQDNKKIESLRELCESDFEREVYDILVNRGYQVQPQVKSGVYRIDFVIYSDSDAKLAVELDGDQYHSGDQWEKDMYRQRVLERAGWQFWRCFASHFYSHKEKFMADLFTTLDSCGIFPENSSFDNSDQDNNQQLYVEKIMYVYQNEYAIQGDVTDAELSYL